MNSQQIQSIYIANGLTTFEITDHDDLMKVYGINTGEIQGYDKLSQEHKTIFDSFILNFYNAQGIERRASLFPESINFILSEQSLGKVKASDDYFIPLGTTITANCYL